MSFPLRSFEINGVHAEIHKLNNRANPALKNPPLKLKPLVPRVNCSKCLLSPFRRDNMSVVNIY